MKPIASTQTSRPSAPCSALSIDSCICSGATRTSTSIRIERATTRAMSLRHMRERREEVEQRYLAARAARLAPARRDARLQGDAGERRVDRRPRHGEPPGGRVHDDDAGFVTRSRTTKWFMSQCRIAGSASWARRLDLDLDAARGRGRCARPDCAARAASRRGRSARRAGGSRPGPVSPSKKALIAARQARPHSLSSLAADERHLAPAEEPEVRASTARLRRPPGRGRRCR